ncbi:metallophosphoesterase (plasmid) [Kurthia sp. YJT4]|uniref:metallophosphoesterase family protein n=1 Tax=Kurthia sp. YJT4 TaxID=3049086 RepID=UPI00254C6888|nr:metallophosphoesterase [Kurthia sp. YJT4]WIL40238.1 metallophosphoesterase [Kurthia sp. YJT4]
MNIDYISDLHLDFYVEPEGNQEKYTAKTRDFLQKLLPETLAEVLVIAGDLSHFNQQSFDTLQFFSEYYKQVFFVFGNHDYYLISKKQRRKYHETSSERETELLEMIVSLPNVQVLQDFDVYTVNGVRFAGSTSWYPLETFEQQTYFKQTSNDSVMIHGLKIEELHHQEMAMYEQMPEVDLLVTHIPPILLDSHRKYGSSACYVNELKEIKASICIFGHCHEQQVYEKAGILFAINALGYPKEGLMGRIRTVSVGG